MNTPAVPKKSRAGSKAPTEVDLHIAARIRARRIAIGMSQQTLAKTADVSFQQVQKYENGKNRIAGSRLQLILDALGMTPADATEGLPRSRAPSGFEETATPYLAEFPAPTGRDALVTDEEAELLILFRQIGDPQARRTVIGAVKLMVARPPPRRGRPPRR